MSTRGVAVVPLARRTLAAVMAALLLAPSPGFAQVVAGTTAATAPAPPAPARPRDGAAVPAASPREGRVDLCGPGAAALAARIAGPDYRLGPGDVLEVQIAGRLEITRHQVVVDPEGAVTLPPLGAVAVGGLSLAEAARRLREQARTLLRYAEVSATVAAPRCVEVVVSGEVAQPGAILVAATHRVHDVLRAAGGITAHGSRRRVEVRTDAGLRVLDLLRFELAGDLAENPVVAERLRVHVPPRAGVVTLAGAVRRPGEYELGPEASLRELLELTGGLTEQAAGRQARLTRLGPEGRRETLAVDLVAVAPPADVRLRPGDELFVPSVAVLQHVVEVRGALLGTAEASRTTTAGKPTIVQRLTLARGERVADVLGRAGGVAPYADLRLAFVDRTGPGGPRQRIPVDLHRLLVDKDETQNLLLENGDVITVPAAEDKVYVLGEVRNPGPVDYRPELTPREYVALAGGPTVRARFREATVTFPSGRSYRLAEAPPLEPGAVVTVPEVAVRWYQDYLTIAQTLASIITAYAGLWLIFRND